MSEHERWHAATRLGELEAALERGDVSYVFLTATKPPSNPSRGSAAA